MRQYDTCYVLCRLDFSFSAFAFDIWMMSYMLTTQCVMNLGLQFCNFQLVVYSFINLGVQLRDFGCAVSCFLVCNFMIVRCAICA